MTEGKPHAFPAWLTHDGPCNHAPADPGHTALVRARFGGRDQLTLITHVIPVSEGSRGQVLYGLLPLLWWWDRRHKRQVRDRTSARLGMPLTPLTLLVLTDKRLRFWQLTSKGHGSRRHFTVGSQIGEIDRSAVRSLTNNSRGGGWRTCVVTLTDGTTAELRVPAHSVDSLVAAFVPA